jgi:superfamily I DNA and/or RNA helicase
LGLVARCRRIVVVGDKKQPPPTRSFDRMIADAGSGDGKETAMQRAESAARITDLESILSLCEARGVESQMLRWRYPVAHPPLTEVSNAEF